MLRDAWTARTLGARVVVVGTAWTEQSPAGVSAVEARDPAALQRGLKVALSGPAGAVKIGMLPTAAAARAIGDALAGWAGPVVFDPVLAASSGGALYQGPIAELAPLLRRATLVTPNLTEAAALAGCAVASVEEARVAAWAILEQGAAAVLVKGGHLAGAAIDLLVSAAGERRYDGPRIAGPSPRGTGCALATAIAVELARGRAVEEAIARAKGWITQAIAAAVEVDGERHLP